MEVLSFALEKSAEASQGAAVRVEGLRERAGVLEGIGASIQNWSTTDALRYITKPDFGPADPNFSLQDHIKQVPFVLEEADREFLAKSNNSESWQYNYQAIQDQRMRQKAMGDTPITAGIFSIIDPVWLAADAVSFGAAGAVQAGRVTKTVVGAVGGAAGAAGISAISGEVRPVTTQEMVTGVLLNAAAAGAVVGIGGKLQKVDPDFPDQALRESLYKPDGSPQVNTIDDAMQAATASTDSLGKRIGSAIEWSIHRSLAKYDSEVADALVDSNVRLATTSAESQIAGVRRELGSLQYAFEDALSAELSNRGAGLFNRVFKTRESRGIQDALERDVAMEMWRRENLVNRGMPITMDGVDPRIVKIADALDNVNAKAADMLKRSGVEGAENITPKSGWFSRTMNYSKIVEMEGSLMRAGKSADEATKTIKGMLARSLRLANPDWDEQLAKDVAASMLNRAKRKGLNEDPLFYSHKGSDVAKQVRDELVESGLPPERIQRVLDVLTAKQAEAGKPGFLKHRVDVDYRTGVQVGDATHRVVDLFDTNITTITERYLDGASARIGMATNGLKSDADVIALRNKFIESVKMKDPNKLTEATELFDNTIAHLTGKPTGQKMNNMLRIGQAWTRTVALAWSGLLQTTEYATAMAHYGMGKTLKYTLQELPIARKLFGEISYDPMTSTKLNDILARSAYQDTRIRPFLQRFEDNFAIEPTDAMMMKMQQGSQLIPYINAMKYVQHHQARVVSNLIIDRVVDAVKGNSKAIKGLEKYGLTQDIMEKLRTDVTEFGLDTAKWSDGTWESARPIMTKMMDESVLKNRLGDVPAFATFDTIGKFVFTFRSFTLAAHNKVLVGTMARDGIGPMALLMMYQFPLTLAATQAMNTIKGDKPLSTEELIARGLGQMGATGLFGELLGVVSGTKQQWGTPGLIALDRAYKFAGSSFSALRDELKGKDGDWGKAAATFTAATPLLAITPGIHAFQNHLKSN